MQSPFAVFRRWDPENGAEGDRTLNLLDATEALSQLSYRPSKGKKQVYSEPDHPAWGLRGPKGITMRLSSLFSNLLTNTRTWP